MMEATELEATPMLASGIIVSAGDQAEQSQAGSTEDPETDGG
jgi:hypothetical protein